jgi:predicted RNA-binding protein Jag
VDEGVTFLQGVFERMKLDLTIAGRIDGKRAAYVLDGPDAEKVKAGLGQGARTVPQALNTLLSMSLGRADKGRPSVSVDLAGDADEEEGPSEMEDVAAFLHERIGELGVPMVILGMDSSERRGLHRCLGDRDGVTTESEGFGSFRRLKIQVKGS